MHNYKYFSQNLTDLFSKQNLWSNIGTDFQKYQQDVIQLFVKNIDYQQDSISQTQNEKNKDIQQKVKDLSLNFELEIKRKLAKILFDSSVNSQEFHTIKKQNYQLQQKLIQNDRNYQITSEEMLQKIKDLQTLVKIYEKALINKQTNVPQLQKSLQVIHQTSKNEEIWKNQHRLIKIHVFDIKIQHSASELEVINRGNLSSSKMSSSILSQSRQKPQALKDLQREWNKSVNLSSKNIKSGHKLSVKKDDKNLIKSHIKSKQMSRSFMKENDSHACKVSDKENKLFQSTVSEFNLNKY